MIDGEGKQFIKLGAAAAFFFFLLSYIGWQTPVAGTLATAAIGLGAVVLSFRAPVLALSLVVGELAMGGLGSWLRFDALNVQLPVRMVIFLAVLGAWAVSQILKAFVLQSVRSLMSRGKVHTWLPLYILAGAVVWGMLWGVVRGNSFASVLLDANGWWYGLMIVPAITSLKSSNEVKKVLMVAIGASVATSVLTLFLYHIFMKDYETAPEVYRWIRDTRLGELTPLFPRGWRVFLQSQLWALVALGWGMVRVWRYGGMEAWRQKVLVYIVITFSLAALILSLSRSYWIGLAVLFAINGIVLLKTDKKALLPLMMRVAGCGVAAFGLIYAVQFTPAVGGVGLPVAQRLSINEPAGSSRMNQLMPLLRGIGEHPVIGSGFGAQVTYKSADPRVVASTAGKSGEYSTYAFEWGYLDMWLKIGLIGLGAYIWLLAKVIRILWIEIKGSRVAGPSQGTWPPPHHAYDVQTTYSLAAACMSSLAAIAFVHITSPYFNHPLGIGMVMVSVSLMAIIIAKGSDDQQKRAGHAVR